MLLVFPRWATLEAGFDRRVLLRERWEKKGDSGNEVRKGKGEA